MIINQEINKLIAEKHELIKRIDKNDYQSRKQKDADLRRLAEVQAKIMDFNYKAINNELKEEGKKKEDDKKLTYKELRKHIRQQYAKYIELNRKLRDLINETVKKKRKGRELYEKLKGKEGVADEKLVDEVLRF